MDARQQLSITGYRDESVPHTFIRQENETTQLAAAELDDEPLTEDERLAIDEAWEDYLAGNAVSLDEAKNGFAFNASLPAVDAQSSRRCVSADSLTC